MPLKQSHQICRSAIALSYRGQVRQSLPPPHPLFVLMQEFESSNPPKSQATAEDLIRSTKGITLASAKAVSAGNSCRQLDISACANLARKAVTELLETCKSAAYKAENGELKAK